MAPYAQSRMYQRGHGLGNVLANLAGRYAVPLIKSQGKKLLIKGLHEGVGYLTDKIKGKKVTAKERAKAVALHGLKKIRKQVAASRARAGKGAGRVKKAKSAGKKYNKKYRKYKKKYNKKPRNLFDA